jgi:CBS domain-containing protein
MEIRDCMKSPVRTVRPTDTIATAAKLMADSGIGAVPVIEDGLLRGIVTDRDIAVRGVAQGLDAAQPVTRVMSADVTSCRPEACIDDVLAEMVTHGVRRIPVCSEGGALVGIVSIGDLARIDWDKEEIGITLGDICRPIRTEIPASAA